MNDLHGPDFASPTDPNVQQFNNEVVNPPRSANGSTRAKTGYTIGEVVTAVIAIPCLALGLLGVLDFLG
ncbi:hypothetical protein LG293_17585 (plasmid) [Citricoccus nitrophenolicus]